MATFTPNRNLEKFENSDLFDNMRAFNENMDKIDKIKNGMNYNSTSCIVNLFDIERGHTQIITPSQLYVDFDFVSITISETGSAGEFLYGPALIPVGLFRQSGLNLVIRRNTTGALVNIGLNPISGGNLQVFISSGGDLRFVGVGVRGV